MSEDSSQICNSGANDSVSTGSASSSSSSRPKTHRFRLSRTIQPFSPRQSASELPLEVVPGPLPKSTYTADLPDLVWFKYRPAAPPPSASPALSASTESLPTAETDDDEWEFVPCLYKKFKDPEQPSRHAWFTLLVCVDGGEDLGVVGDSWLADLSSLLEADVFAPEYTGFGLHHGRLSERAICNDVAAAFRYLTTVEKLTPDRVIVCGKGVGCVPVLALTAALALPDANEIMDGIEVEKCAPGEAMLHMISGVNLYSRRKSLLESRSAKPASRLSRKRIFSKNTNKADSMSSVSLSTSSLAQSSAPVKITGEEVAGIRVGGAILIAPRPKGLKEAKQIYGDDAEESTRKAPRVLCPVLYLHPAEFLAVSPTSANKFASSFKNLYKFIVVRGTNYNNIIENDMEFLDDIAKFLEHIGKGEYVLRSVRQAPEQFSQSPNVVIGKWFSDRGLPEFAEPVLAAGYYKLEDLITASVSDWDAIGVTNPNMRQLIIASLKQNSKHIDPKKNPYVCIGRNVPCEKDTDKTFNGGSVRWLVGSFQEPTMAPDIVSLHVLVKTIGTSRTKCILEAIAAFEDDEEHSSHPEAKTESDMMSPPMSLKSTSLRMEEMDYEMESHLSKSCAVEEDSDNLSEKAEAPPIKEDTDPKRKTSLPPAPTSLREVAAMRSANGRKKAESLSGAMFEKKKKEMQEAGVSVKLDKESPIPTSEKSASPIPTSEKSPSPVPTSEKSASSIPDTSSETIDKTFTITPVE